MDRLTLYYFLIGMAVFLFCQGVFLLLQEPIAYRLDLNRRMKMILITSDRDKVLVDLLKARGLNHQGQLRYPLLRRFNILLLQSGSTAGAPAIFTMMGVIAAISYLIFGVFGRMGFSLGFPIAASLGLLLPILYLTFQRSRRQRKFASQLPDAIDVITRSLRAGHPLPVALNLVARETGDPLGSEFGILSDEIAYGASLTAALQNLEVRVGLEELGILSTAIAIQSETGGNLMELLMNLSTLMREREKMRRKIRTLTSEGRFSGAALSVLPFLLFAALNLIAPSFYGDVWKDPAAKVALLCGLIWMLLGIYVMRRMVNFKF